MSLDEDEDDFVLCTSTEESKPVQKKTKRYNLLIPYSTHSSIATNLRKKNDVHC